MAAYVVFRGLKGNATSTARKTTSTARETTSAAVVGETEEPDGVVLAASGTGNDRARLYAEPHPGFPHTGRIELQQPRAEFLGPMGMAE